MTSRRLALLSCAALAFVVAACSASSGAEGPVTTALERVGVLPAQAPLTLPAGVESTDGGVAGETFAEGGTTRAQVVDNRVFLEGDSVLRGLGIGDPDPLDLYVASLGWKLTLDAEDGRFTDEGVDRVLARRSEVHEVLVTMLGNNYGGDEVAFAAELQRMIDAFPQVKLFVMFTVPEFEPLQREVNAVLRELAAGEPRILLVDWELLTRTYDAIADDGVHPTVTGRDVLAQALGLALGKAPGAGPGVTLPALGSTVRPNAPGTNKGENTSVASTIPAQTTTTRSSAPTSAATSTTKVTTTTKPGTSTTLPGGSTTTLPGGSTTTTVLSGSTTSISGATTTAAGTTSSAAPTTAPPTTAAPTTAASTTAAPTTTPTTSP